MNLIYFLLLITLKNINCYNPKRHTVTSPNLKHLKSKTSDPVIPARYKVKSKVTNNDPAITSFPTDFFPEVEYPENIVDSSKPFYLSTSPFPNEVRSSFNNLIAKEKSKIKTTTDYSWVIEKTKETESPKVSVNEVKDAKDSEINNNGNESANETIDAVVTSLDFEDDTSHHESNYSDNIVTNFMNSTSAEESIECENIDYVVDFINDLDELMKNLTKINASIPNDENNPPVPVMESECSDEFTSLDMTPNNNDSIIEFNGNYFLKEECPVRDLLCEESDTNDDNANLTPLFNEYTTNTSFVDDMQSNYCSIGMIANYTNTSCFENKTEEFALNEGTEQSVSNTD